MVRKTLDWDERSKNRTLKKYLSTWFLWFFEKLSKYSSLFGTQYCSWSLLNKSIRRNFPQSRWTNQKWCWTCNLLVLEVYHRVKQLVNPGTNKFELIFDLVVENWWIMQCNFLACGSPQRLVQTSTNESLTFIFESSKSPTPEWALGDSKWV